MKIIGRSGVFACIMTTLISFHADACTRILYETGTKNHIVGRTMDWAEDPGTDLWAFPQGMVRDGGVGEASIKWKSKYGSVIASFYNIGTVEGMKRRRARRECPLPRRVGLRGRESTGQTANLGWRMDPVRSRQLQNRNGSS